VAWLFCANALPNPQSFSLVTASGLRVDRRSSAVEE
jgi:hypothetical protein